MSAQTNAVSEASFGANAAAQPRMRATRPVYWTLRRELWENWWLWGAPLSVAALVVLGTIVAAFYGKGNLLSLDPGQQQLLVAVQCQMIANLIMGTTLLLTIFYCLDALYGERRDRSVLFWRSLPVSDTVTVLSKAAVAVVLLPLLTIAVAVATQWIVLLIDASTLVAHGRSVSVIGQVPVMQLQAGLAYHMVAVHALWYAPLYAWLLLVSAWARRVPFLWAFVIPLAIGVVEKIAFNTTHFAHFIGYRVGEGTSGSVFGSKMMVSGHPMAMSAPGQFFLSSGLWGGLFVAGLFLAGAVWLRRYRTAN